MALFYQLPQSYMDYFAQSLNEQYSEEGITIQTLLPLMVAEKGSHMPSAMSLLVPSASSYAKEAVTTLGWSDRSNGSLRIQVQVNYRTLTWVRDLGLVRGKDIMVRVS